MYNFIANQFQMGYFLFEKMDSTFAFEYHFEGLDLNINSRQDSGDSSDIILYCSCACNLIALFASLYEPKKKTKEEEAEKKLKEQEKELEKEKEEKKKEEKLKEEKEKEMENQEDKNNNAAPEEQKKEDNKLLEKDQGEKGKDKEKDKDNKKNISAEETCLDIKATNLDVSNIAINDQKNNKNINNINDDPDKDLDDEENEANKPEKEKEVKCWEKVPALVWIRENFRPLSFFEYFSKMIIKI